jgi:hypothetical protein
MSSIRRSKSVTQGHFSTFWAAGLSANEKSGFLTHSFCLARPANPMRMARI